MSDQNLKMLSNYETLKSKHLKLFNDIINFHKESQSSIIIDRYVSGHTLITNNRFKIAVLGEQKRGKSKLINALISQRILPEGVIPVSNTIVEIQNNEAKKATVLYADGNSELIKIEKLKEYCDEANNPNNEKKVNKVFVDYPCELLGNSVTLVDTPGENSVYKYHSDILHNYIPESAAIIFLISCDNPISSSEVDFLNKTIVSHNINKVFFVLSKIDKYADNPNELNQLINFNKKSLSKVQALENCDYHFLTISSNYYFDGDKNGDEYLLNKSGIIELKNLLSNFIEKDKAEVIIKKFNHEIKCLLNELSNEFEKKMELINVNKQTLEQTLEKLNFQKIEYENKINDSLNKFHQVIANASIEFNILTDKLKDYIISDINHRIDNISKESEIHILSKIIEEEIIDKFQNNMEEITRKVINPGLKNLYNEIEKISTNFKNDMKLIIDSIGLNFSFDSLFSGIGILSASLAAYLGISTATIATTTITSYPIYYLTLGFYGYTTATTTSYVIASWLLPVGIALIVASSLLGKVLAKMQFDSVKSKFKSSLCDQSITFINKSRDNVIKDLEIKFNDIKKNYAIAINNDIQSLLNSINEIKNSKDSNELNIIYEKTKCKIEKLKSFKNDLTLILPRN